MAPQERLSQLSAFLSFLSDAFSWEFDRDEFEDRFLLQKYVFFAQRLGFGLPYKYNIYVFGAYSPALAQDYYSAELPGESRLEHLPDSFDADTFGALIKNRDSRWLEIASTLTLYDEQFQFMAPEKRRQKTIEKTRVEKDTTERSARQIYENLVDFGLIE